MDNDTKTHVDRQTISDFPEPGREEMQAAAAAAEFLAVLEDLLTPI